MAPINPNNTQRFFLDYSTCGESHTLLCRAGSTVIAADAGATIGAFLFELTDQIYQMTVTGFRSSAPGTNITVPEVWPGNPTYGTGVGTHDKSAQYIDFVGRGATGHRVRVAVFGAINVSLGGDYRATAAEEDYVSACIAALTSDGDIFLDVDYEVPNWHQYANLGVNAYWRNQIR